ncbi:response regulator transcription factor [Streptomyces tuirus]|uniref:Response regulator transcription factor n=1 Tax=Streptomyces tuirus TaxID=68278 RepID=A0A941FD86_9ACTN|nr:response regulator transcription factor [Streptomyces tuirus]
MLRSVVRGNGVAGANMLEVAVCSDSELFRAGILQYINSQPGGAVLVEAGGNLFELVETLKPAAVVIDGHTHFGQLAEFVGAPQAGGTPTPPMVVVGLPTAIDAAVTLLCGPVRGLLPADCRPPDFHAAVRAAVSGDYYLSAKVFGPLLAKLNDVTLVPQNGAGLTGREAEILGKLAEGRSSADIAALLSLSKRTVGFHISNILAKLGASSRAQAVAYAYQSGLLRPPTGLGKP